MPYKGVSFIEMKSIVKSYIQNVILRQGVLEFTFIPGKKRSDMKMILMCVVIKGGKILID